MDIRPLRKEFRRLASVVWCVLTAGCAVLYAAFVRSFVAGSWEDLLYGMPLSELQSRSHFLATRLCPHDGSCIMMSTASLAGVLQLLTMLSAVLVNPMITPAAFPMFRILGAALSSVVFALASQSTLE